jgi:acetyl esterase/lipase
MPPVDSPFDPDLVRAARWIPRTLVTRRRLPLIRLLTHVVPAQKITRGVTVKDVWVPGNPPVRVRLYRPEGLAADAPALLWIHGGGYVIGRPEMDDSLCAVNARDLGALIVSVDYRLAPDHPFPAPLEDCYTALRWLFAEAPALGVSTARIAIGGASAGGGLSAALAMLARDRAELKPIFQLLVYPMLDDRSGMRTDLDGKLHRMWSQRSNRFGWSAYLGSASPEQAVPARREDLAGLPPAWVGVGTCDLFHDEDLEYARRLTTAGVPCDVWVSPGAFHGFDVVRPGARVSRDFRGSYLTALRRAFA